MELCPFCRIVRDELPAYIVYEDDNCLAFLDERPVFPGHTLLVPKQHYETLLDVPQHLLVSLFSKVQLLTRAIRSGFGSDGAFIGINHRVSQRVPHLHIHLVPRKFKDGLRGFFWPRGRYESVAQASEVQDRLKAAIGVLPR